MSKKRAIKVLRIAGTTYTSRQQALRWIRSGRARYVDEDTIRMVEEDHRHRACMARTLPDSVAPKPPSPPAQSPTPERVVEFIPDTFTGQTFLHYPQPDSFESD